jgi:hypothetical protein
LDHTLILIGSGCLVCLMPVAIYLLYLSHLNSRNPPTLVPGPWDFAGVLLALSGFLLLSGPLLLTLVNSVWRYYAFGNWANLKFVSSKEAWAASLIVTGYLIILAAGITFLLRRRRPVTAVYNVDPLGLDGGFIVVLDELGYAWRRVNARIEIGTKKLTEPVEPVDRFSSGETATVRIDTFPSSAHATLRWGGDYENVRPEVESVLPRALPSAGRNPVAGWMFTAAVSVMVVMLLWLIVLVVVIMEPKPG